MQPFDLFRDIDRTRRKPMAPRRLGYAETPAFAEVMREMGLVLFACLALAAAATVLVPLLGAN